VKDSEGKAEKQSSSLGSLEFAILGGLAILLVVAFTALFGEDFRTWIDNLTQDRTPPQVVFTVQETGGFSQPVEQEVIVIYNCDFDEEIVEDVLRSNQFTPIFQLEDELNPELEEVLSRQLEAYYGLEQGEEYEGSFNLQLTASAESQAEYTIEWQYVWIEGVLHAAWVDESEDEFAYQALTGIDFRTVSISQSDCP
jgi:hypothetical protein